MKRFQWRLQRVLDITGKREQALEAELVALARAIRALRSEAERRRRSLAAQLSAIAGRPLAQRMAELAVFMDFAGVVEREIADLGRQVDERSAERDRAREAYLKARSTRRALERLREEAREAWRRDTLRREQAAFDESFHVGYARRHARGAAPAAV